MAFAPDLRAFASGRNFAAWLGLVPRQRSTGGKTLHGGVSKMGQTDIRKLLIVGAMSRIRWIIRKGVMPETWLGRIVAREPRMVAAVALANCPASALLRQFRGFREGRSPMNQCFGCAENCQRDVSALTHAQRAGDIRHIRSF
ncbi:transposase [Bosea sp. RCC_152_1]